MRVNDDLMRMGLMAECLEKQPVFLVQERPWDGALANHQFCHSGILCFHYYWTKYFTQVQMLNHIHKNHSHNTDNNGGQAMGEEFRHA